MIMEPWRADMFMEPIWCGGAQMMEMDALMMIIDDEALTDGFETLHFMVEPMVQLMHLMIAWSFNDGDGGPLLEPMHLMMALGPC